MKREYNKPTLNIEEVSLISAITSTSDFGGISPLPGEVEVGFDEWDEFFK